MLTWIRHYTTKHREGGRIKRVHTKSRPSYFVQREDKSEKNWSGSWSRPLSSCSGHISPVCGDEADVEARTTMVQKGDGGWEVTGMARWESRRRRRGHGGESRRVRRGGDGGVVEVSRVGGECRPTWRGRTGFPVKTLLLRGGEPCVACFQTSPSSGAWKPSSWAPSTGKWPAKVGPYREGTHGQKSAAARWAWDRSEWVRPHPTPP